MCKKLVCLISFVILLSAVSGVQADEFIIDSDADTYMRDDVVRGDYTFMDVRGGGIDFAGYLRFDLSDLSILSVEDANLILRSSGGASRNDVIVTPRFSLYGLNNVADNTPQNWDEATLSETGANPVGAEWNGVVPLDLAGGRVANLDMEDGIAVTETVIAGLAGSGYSDPGWFRVTVTGNELISFIQSRVDDDGLVTFIIGNDDGTDRGFGFCTKENATEQWRPVLELTATVGAKTLATMPNPSNRSTDVCRHAVLSWTPGIYADKHDVYFGTDFNDVNSATDPNVLPGRGRQSAATYDPGTLEFGTTYYWRVDEVNDACAPGLWEGNVWRFTVEQYSYPLTIDEIDVNASSEWDAARAAINTINESGLNENDEHSVDNFDMWLSENSSEAWIEYTFDKVYKLHEMWVWNFNDEFNYSFGCKDVNVEYSVNGTDWTSMGIYEFAIATGEPNYTHNTTVDMSDVVAQYVRLTSTSTWGGGGLHGLSEVRFYYIPMRARDPDPASGLTNVPIDATLSFRAGREAAQHDIYLSENEQAVINETADVCSIPASGCDASYAPSLGLAKTYYWKVNEVNMNKTPSTWEGDVWQFSTPEYLIIDNMDSYVGRDGIIAVWKDGYATFENGSNVTLSTVIDSRNPVGHQAPGPIHEGSDAMQFVYDNDKNITIYVPDYDPYSYSVSYYYSEAEANTVDLECISDWTTADVKLLSLYFSGDPDNDIGTYEQMYIALKDGEGDIAVVKYGDSVGEDANNLQSREWTEWAIELEEFETVNASFNLNNVEKVYIGFGERFNNTTAGGSGVVYFDSIRLYTPKCVPAAVVDLTGDCTMDMEDFIIMANSWKGKPSTAVPIIDLQASNFAGGTWTNSGSLGGQFDVNIFDINDNPSSGMVDGLLAVTFDGNDYLIADFNAPGGITGANDFTVIAKIFNPAIADEEMILTWARRGGPAYTTGAVGYGTDPAWGAVIHWNEGGEEPDMGFDGGVPAADMWHEIAASYDGVTERVLVDGKLNAIENKTLNIYADDPVTVGAGYDWDFNDVNDPNDPPDFIITTLYLSSSVNRIRVYDEGMAQHQLEHIMTGSYSADLDGDGDVDFKDLAMMLDDWLKERLFP